MALLEAHKVSRSFTKGKHGGALSDVTLTIEEGECLAVMGKNGSGKSTLLRLLGLLDYPTSGQILLDGQDVSHLPEQDRLALRFANMGFIFQERTLISELTAMENVGLPALIHGRRGYQAEAKKWLAEVGLAESDWKLLPHQLSPGQRQRVSVARIMMEHPRILFADEPTASLDPAGTGIIMKLIQRLNVEQGVTVVYITNDTADEKYAKNLLILDNGTVMASGPVMG